MARVHFLSDIFEHLNIPNLQLQGRHKTIIDPVENLRAFKVKLNLFSNDLNFGKFCDFLGWDFMSIKLQPPLPIQ